ncbi:hypothetical protein Ddye_016084 [Dipteronia dyeriana]|uniref:Ubiquitin-like domain-containing protein n=1 Tax=Dipteronia dyeriana TaxID=168575 RepID=A0AAD9U6W4_9ROSI|nr:hypothetical protein Ddye_016084 [Dipteronia dyeriana]
MSATGGGGGQEEDKKPMDQGAHINLKVKGQDGNEVFFRIKRSTQLRKLMTAYCDRQSVELNSIAFLFDGRRLRAEQTPDEVWLLLCMLIYYGVCLYSSTFYGISSRWRMEMKSMQCCIRLEEGLKFVKCKLKYMGHVPGLLMSSFIFATPLEILL